MNFDLILQNNNINNISEVRYDNLTVEADAIIFPPTPVDHTSWGRIKLTELER